MRGSKPWQRTLSSALLFSTIIMPLYLAYAFLNVQVTLPKEELYLRRLLVLLYLAPGACR